MPYILRSKCSFTYCICEKRFFGKKLIGYSFRNTPDPEKATEFETIAEAKKIVKKRNCFKFCLSF